MSYWEQIPGYSWAYVYRPDDNGGYLCFDGDFKEDFIKAIHNTTKPINAGNTTGDSPISPEDSPECENPEEKA